MPATVVRDPLGLSCVFTNGTRWSYVVDVGANPRLGADLLTGLAGLVHPHGRVDSRHTVMQYGLNARIMVDRLAAQGFRGGAGDLTRARLTSFWMAASSLRIEASTRRMLGALDAQTGVLRAEVRELVAGRRFTRLPKAAPLSPYSEGEWTRLRDTCRRVIKDAYRAHRRAQTDAATGQDPRLGGLTHANVAWLLSRLGPCTLARVAGHLGRSVQTLKRSPGVVPAMNAALFPTTDVVLAYRMLFGVYTSIVPDGVDGLGLGDLDWAGDTMVLLDYVKGRTAKESLTLSPNAVRLLEQWLEHSALLRRFMSPDTRGHLWPRFVLADVRGVSTKPVWHRSMRLWTRRYGLLDDSGRPLRLHRPRIRTTFLAMRDRRAWFGSTRATIDPNHSPQVEGDHYLSTATPAQKRSVDDIIVTAQTDLVRKALPPLVIESDQAVDAAKRLPDLVSRLALSDASVAELVGGTRDVFVAACADPLSGLHGPAGKPCPARPWVCLLCPLAVFTPRHASNLLRLKAFFSRQGKQMTSAEFIAVFGPYAVRIEEILGYFDPTHLARVASEVNDTDDEVPLRPEETTR